MHAPAIAVETTPAVYTATSTTMAISRICPITPQPPNCGMAIAGCVLVTDNERDFRRIRRFVPFEFTKPWPGHQIGRHRH